MKQLFLLLFGLALFVLPYCQAQPLTSEEHPVTLNTASGSINGKQFYRHMQNPVM